MKTNKPTSGPWKLLKGGDVGQAEFGASHTGDYVAVFGANDEPICSSGDKCYEPHPVSEANAHLIASAGTSASQCEAMGYDGIKCVEKVGEMVKAIEMAQRKFRAIHGQNVSDLTEMETPYCALLASLK